MDAMLLSYEGEERCLLTDQEVSEGVEGWGGVTDPSPEGIQTTGRPEAG